MPLLSKGALFEKSGKFFAKKVYSDYNYIDFIIYMKACAIL